MDPVVTVDNDSVTVEPGGQANVIVRVRNLSSIVEGFRLDVLGDAAPWAQVLPGSLEVLPQGEAQATVLFAPPSGVATRAGQVPFAVRAVSQVDPSSSAVAEGDLHVGNVALSQSKITPATSKGRFSGKHRIELSNWGNTPLRLALEVSDPDEALGFLLTPDVLDLPLGTTGTAKLKVRARKPFFRGAPLRRSFRVVGRPLAPGEREPAPGPAPQPYGYDPNQPAVDGAFEQRAIIGRGVLPVAVVALVAAGAIGFLTSRSGDDPADEAVAGPAPLEFTAAALTGDTVRLSWQPGERADSYTAFVIDPATRDEPTPTALDVSEPIPGDQGQHDIAELAPGVEHCFQLAAVRGEATSARTEPQCVTTPQVGAPGAPPPPTEVQAERTDDGKVRVSWGPSEGAESYVVSRGSTVVQQIDAPVTETTADATADELCFSVTAKTADLVSEPSGEACVEPATEGEGEGQPGGPGGVGTPGGPAPDNLGVIAVDPNRIHQVEDPSALTLASNSQAALQALGLQAGVLLSSDYPDIQPQVTNASYLVYVPGYGSASEAIADCASKGLTCVAFTPGAPTEGATVPVLPPSTPAAPPPPTAPPATTATTAPAP